MLKELEGSTVERETHIDATSYLTFTLSPSVTKHLVPFLKKLEAAKDLIQDFSISQTTLEEVFLKVRTCHLPDFLNLLIQIPVSFYFYFFFFWFLGYFPH